MKTNLPLCLVAALAVSPLVQSSAIAGAYKAICSGGAECTVMISGGRIVMPGVSIPREQILSWSQGGSGSKTDVGLGVATTVLFGLPGLLGFGAKTHDYQYQINYVDENGNVNMASVGFKNDTPSNQFMMELMGMTGLTAGEINNELQANLENIKAKAAEEARIAALDCARQLKPYKCSWSAYVEANPAAKIWADKYPNMVPAEKSRLRAVD